MVRAEWAERIADRRREVNLADKFERESRSYVEIDANGAVVRREPRGRRR